MSRFAPRDLTAHPPALTPAYVTSRLRSPRKPLVLVPGNLEDFEGPVFSHDAIGELDHDLVHNFASAGESAIGPRIAVHGRVIDQNANPVPNSLLEIWQANAGGRYRHPNDSYVAPLDPNFSGCGRTITDGEGQYRFFTIQPAPYPWPNHENAWRPMHIHFSVFGHAFAQRLVTQMYFEGDPLIAHCPIVQGAGEPKIVERMVARLDLEASASMDHLAYRFDIVLRGPNQSLFEETA